MTYASARLPLLGGHTATAFLRRFWHKEALRVTGALPGFRGLHSLAELKSLAARDDVESRLVVRSGREYTLAHGPLRKSDFRGLPDKDWTLLVQGINLHDAPSDALLRRFSFLPSARLDDLMVSYAVTGGGVGPHFDSYDVFLLQGFGRRRWRYGRQDDLALRPNLPVKILKSFTPEHDHVFAPGDLLYLPPAYAHDGVALEPCTTYSIGFRAAANTELAQQFLDFLRDRIELPGRYADPDLRLPRETARIDAVMQRRIARTLAGIRWDAATVNRFLGCLLTEPKPSVFFSPPEAPLSRAAFAAALRKRGVALDRRTQWLFDDDALYVNGEAHDWPAGDRAALVALANARALPAAQCASLAPATLAFLHQAYRDGYLAPA
ncbi:MAG: cupin domain-containing protein [Burkholderiales bacterium]